MRLVFTENRREITFIASVCDEGSYFDRNFSGWTIITWPGDTFSRLDTSELNVWRKVKSSLNALPDRHNHLKS